VIDLQGESTDIEHFLHELRTNPPPLSQIESIERHDDVGSIDFERFEIVDSVTDGRKVVPVSADVATCADCLSELFDPTNRRFRYPFINCTNCGPRFTIIQDVPYDRRVTTMNSFTMCDACQAEYEDPSDRRFHAEPNACAVCGPRLRLLDLTGSEVSRDPLSLVRELLVSGKILAIKGIGGFHLACDALDEAAVEKLRRRKFREDKPFALMARSQEVVSRYCDVSKAEALLLQSIERPIVLLRSRRPSPIPHSVAPGVSTLGFMLPYSPLHHLLFADFDRPLVMTSGNVSDEPICYDDDEAAIRLQKIADYFLVHDRRIYMRMDDSVTRVVEGSPTLVRRSRGYAPSPIKTSFEFQQPILACGAELKNTFCLAREHHAFVSHHIGDLENLETLRSFTTGIEHFKRLFAIDPEVVAYDLHPEYLSSKYAQSLDCVDKIGVQHHHAHVASCMVDNDLDTEVIGVAFDGLGFGLDGKFWGGEFFVADLSHADRLAHLVNVPLPGGTRAIREPWRMAATYLHRTFGDEFRDLQLPFCKELEDRGWKSLRSMMRANFNSPETSSIGRLFDAMAALLGVRSSINYEGQAAIELEAIADQRATDIYRFPIAGNEIRADEPVRRAVEDLLSGVTAEQVSARFHLSVAQMIVDVAAIIREQHRLNRVVLSGGVFQNMLLVSNVSRLLRNANFEVFAHRRVPTNDGGISLGQAAIANARISRGRNN
jgi:hydrogenase maturation protein HypF